MKAVWVDAGNDPDYEKVQRYQMTHLYFALTDPRVTKAYLASVAARGFGVGVYAAWNWPEFSGNGIQFAEKVAAKVKPLVVSPSNPKVQLDDEEHDPQRIQDMAVRWRELMPKQDTSWTMESMQGGWMSDNLVSTIVSKKVRVVPQYYHGDMSPVAQDIAFKNLLNRGFPANLITGFYDAAHLPANWDGFAFLMGRLP